VAGSRLPPIGYGLQVNFRWPFKGQSKFVPRGRSEVAFAKRESGLERPQVVIDLGKKKTKRAKSSGDRKGAARRISQKREVGY